MFSPKTCFLHFWAFNLNSSVTDWPKTLSLYTNRFAPWPAARSFFFLRSSSSIRGGETAPRLAQPPPQVCRGKWPKWPCRRELTHVRPESIPESESESESIPEGRSRSRSRSHLETHRLRSPAEEPHQTSEFWRSHRTYPRNYGGCSKPSARPWYKFCYGPRPPPSTCAKEMLWLWSTCISDLFNLLSISRGRYSSKRLEEVHCYPAL